MNDRHIMATHRVTAKQDQYLQDFLKPEQEWITSVKSTWVGYKVDPTIMVMSSPKYLRINRDFEIIVPSTCTIHVHKSMLKGCFPFFKNYVEQYSDHSSFIVSQEENSTLWEHRKAISTLVEHFYRDAEAQDKHLRMLVTNHYTTRVNMYSLLMVEHFFLADKFYQQVKAIFSERPLQNIIISPVCDEILKFVKSVYPEDLVYFLGVMLLDEIRTSEVDPAQTMFNITEIYEHAPNLFLDVYHEAFIQMDTVVVNACTLLKEEANKEVKNMSSRDYVRGKELEIDFNHQSSRPGLTLVKRLLEEKGLIKFQGSNKKQKTTVNQESPNSNEKPTSPVPEPVERIFEEDPSSEEEPSISIDH